MRLPHALGASLAFVLLAPPPAAADPFTFNDPIVYVFRGTVSTLFGDILYFMPNVSLGDSFTATLEYDLHPSPTTPNSPSYLTVRLGSYRMFGQSFRPTEPPFWYMDYASHTGFAQGGIIDSMGVRWAPLPGLLSFTISAGGSPTCPSVPGPFIGCSGTLQGAINSVSVHRVPEPSTAVLMLLAAGAAGLYRRRHAQ